jgi:hypothetical protein
MSQALENMMKGLVLHFLHQKTVVQAIEQGRKAGVHEELLECLPGMMFEITSAACAVQTGERTLDDMVDQITEKALASGNAEDFGKDDVFKMLQMTLSFIRELYQDADGDKPLPALTEPWFHYQMAVPIGGCCGPC